MRSIAKSSPIRSGKRRLLESGAVAAGLAALACGGPALAQVAANPVFVNVGVGSSINSSNGTKTTTVNVTQNQSVINWIPTDNAPTGGTIDVLPADSTWDFNGAGNYVVLNRFTNGAGGSLSRQIALSGTVNSYDVTTGAQGGSIWFYNAGGILINSGAAINVGSLVLTTNDIDRTGGLFGPSGEIRFRGASGSTSTVQIDPGAFINAGTSSAGGAYVALVAPRIVQSGNVYVNGSAAYVAAEQADIRINAGLFDINVLTGAEGGNAITHTGITTGPEQQASGAAQRIYMVAIPKNDAVSILVSGQVGYQDAVSAVTDSDGAVVLSAGYNVTGGTIDAAPANATAANITVNDIIFHSNTTAHASGDFVGQPLSTIPAGGPVSVPPPPQLGLFQVEGNGSFSGDASATMNIGANQAGGATGSFQLVSGGAATADGVATFTVDGGQFSADGGLVVQAAGTPDTVTGNAGGGTASLNIRNGGFVSAPTIDVAAIATGGIGSNGAGGNATGGNASITVDGSDSQLSTNALTVSASAQGGGLFDGQNGTEAVDNGGSARGGTATVTASNGGNIAAESLLQVNADGFGQIGVIQSGSGTGGTARIVLTDAGSRINTGATEVSANGTGGGDNFGASGVPLYTLNGGAGTGGTATITINTDASTSISLGETNLSANGQGGEASNGNNSNSGDGTGGAASFALAAGDVSIGDLTVTAEGSGGISSTVAGTGTGGTATIALTGGTLTGADITAAADGYGGDGANGFESFSAPIQLAGAGGVGQGGTATITIGGTATASTSTLSAEASGYGGYGGDFFNSDASIRNGGNGGNGIGGNATIQLNAGNLDTGGLATTASGYGGLGGSSLGSSSSGMATGVGVGGQGGSGTGGSAVIDMSVAATIDGPLSSSSTGSGGSGGSGMVGGNGGAATGGLAQVAVHGFDAGPLGASINASAYGGNGSAGSDGAGGNGGSATGGTARLTADGANASATVVGSNMRTLALGGNGGSGATGFFTDVAVGANGGNGGTGTGGTLEIIADNGAFLLLTAGEGGVNVNSLGYGGHGGNGANNNNIAGRTGGDGGNGGDGIGGNVRLLATGGTISTDGAQINLGARGLAGIGGGSGQGTTAGNNGVAGVNRGGHVLLQSLASPTGAALIDLGATTIDAGGATAGRIELRTDSSIRMTSLNAQALGTAAPTNNDTSTAAAGIFLGVNNGGTIASTGALSLTTGGSIGTYAQGNGQVAAGGNMVLQADDQIDIRHDMRTGAAPTILAGGNLTGTATTGISGAPGSLLAAGGDLALTAGAAIGVADLNGGTVALDGATGITAGVVTSNAATTLTSANGNLVIASLQSGGPVDATANSITISDGGDLDFASLTTTVGDARIQTSGNLSVADGSVAGLADLRNGGDTLDVASLTARDANLASTGGRLALIDVAATGGITASAAGPMLIDGVVSGQTISLASGDIAIGGQGRVGTAAVTQTLSIRNNDSSSQTFIGGTGTRPGYHLDADEIGRLYGANMTVIAPAVTAAGSLSVGSAAPPDLIIDSFTLAGGSPASNLGASGSLTIQTSGKGRVIGAVSLTGLTDTNTLTIAASEALEVILGQGSIRLTNGSNPAGMLNLRSADIIVATPQAIADVAAATTLDTIEQRLAQNDGIASDDGALFAGGISANVSGGFYVQNSGAGTDYAQRRGLTFAGGGLNVIAQSPSARIVINGVQLGPSGQVTGLNTIKQLSINGSAPTPGTFDPRSTFNGCTITATGACTFGGTEFPVQDVIDDPEKPDKDGGGIGLPTPLITIRDIDPLSGEPLLDDPVTGAGNDDLWTPVSP